MTAVWAETRERKAHFAVEFQFLRDNFEGSSALFVALTFVSATNSFFEDAVLGILDMVREIFGKKGNFILAGFWIAPNISLFACLLFDKREILLGNGFVVGKRR